MTLREFLIETKASDERYLKSKKMRKVEKDLKKRAKEKGIENPGAYIFGTKRKILKQHLAKTK